MGLILNKQTLVWKNEIKMKLSNSLLNSKIMDRSGYVVLILPGNTEDTNTQMFYPDLTSTLKRKTENYKNEKLQKLDNFLY